MKGREGHSATESGCHGGREKLREAAAAAGKSTTLDRYAADYPMGRMTSRRACARLLARYAWG